MIELKYEEQALGVWNAIHKKLNLIPYYPSEHIVRFLKRSFPDGVPTGTKGIDIGTGSGRHTKLLCEFGIEATGIDFSEESINNCSNIFKNSGYPVVMQQASMLDIPFAENTFDIAISYGVYYYVNSSGMAKAVSELHRILRPGGSGHVVVRTDNDYRYGKGLYIEPHTFQIDIEDTGEYGTVMHFLREEDIQPLFKDFSKVNFERTETTFNNRTGINSDWLITVKK